MNARDADAELKYRLANAHFDDRAAYTAAKAAFIEDILLKTGYSRYLTRA